jgi:coproporphyrinogen III oxidase
LLNSWVAKLAPPQDLLLRALISALPDVTKAPIDSETKAKLAQVIREHYSAHPEALNTQAKGKIVPKTIANHDLLRK